MTRWLTIAIRGAAIFLLAKGMASAQPAAFTIGPVTAAAGTTATGVLQAPGARSRRFDRHLPAKSCT